ncbi:GatB/YqeY domain-containing protein [uncultured Zoogloea sp.]|uniref:GatB/YqeY domain-containing protein n=1 Tax=uncultured Zoogloea sp. TaxID=160237 RepID=UPI00260B66A1|nr:GatB/YqeY domain-containing protein [uncultured Zoogloea sp.]
MSLKAQINEDMKAAMRAKETARLSALRLLLAAIKQKEVDERIELDDAAVITVVDKMLKQRRDSVTQYEAAQRFDLASAERFEIDVLTTYKPAGLTVEQIAAEVDAAIASTGAASAADMGKLMAVLKPKLAGKADMAEVSKLVKSRLTN